MKHEEQLNDFFEHALSPAEEQNFLISVAASDELRIAFRSQLELMKAVRSDKDSLRIGASGPVAQVRNRTLAALGLSATAATPFIEHELLRSGSGGQALAAPQAASLTSIANDASIANNAGMQWIGHLLHTPIAAITAGLVLGILSTTAVEHFTASSAVLPANSSGIHARVFDPSMNTPVRPRMIEPIPAKNGLHNMDEQSPSGYVAPVKARQARMAAHHAGRVLNSNTMIGTATVKASAPSAIPEELRNQPGQMHSNKPIIRTNDTAKATK